MDLRDLRYFETIAELEHLGRAAARLHRSPAALTKCIGRLEESLGAELFQREGRNIRLTAAGRALRKRARLLDVAAEDARREVAAVAHGASGHVRVGVAPTLAQYLLPGACRAFLAEAGEVTLETRIGISSVLRDALRTGDVDLAMTVADGGDEFATHAIVDDEMVVVAGAGHDILARRATVADLARYRWVLPGASYDSDLRRFVDAAFRRHGLPPPRVQIETNSVTFLPNLIAATRLLSFISRRNLGKGHVAAPLREVRLKELSLHRQFALLYRRDAYLSPAALRFVDLLRSKGQSLYGKA